MENTSSNDQLPLFTGTEVGYFFVCHKKLWWFAHGIQMEQGHERVSLGKLVHQDSYPRQRKEIDIDGKIVLDWREDGIIHEIKLSDKMKSAHEMQLLYYLYYLKRKGIEVLHGQIDYPKLRQSKMVVLSAEKEALLESVFVEMQQLISLPHPPKMEWMRLCRSCSYAELCWG
jgi:CRISPR-associated exonuclease Cas4